MNLNRLNTVVLAAAGALAGCAETPDDQDRSRQVPEVTDSGNPEYAPHLTCREVRQKNVPVTILRGSVRLEIIDVITNRRSDHHGVAFELEEGDTLELPVCVDRDTTFELELTPRSERFENGNRAEIQIGPNTDIDFRVSGEGKGGDEVEVFQSSYLQLGFDGERGQPESFDLEVLPWHLK